MTEIREKRSMAYSAGAYIGTPALPGNPTYLFGNIGTQNDKANDALDVFMGLVTDMPKNADRIDNIKSYIRQEMLTTHPSFRDLLGMQSYACQVVGGVSVFVTRILAVKYNICLPILTGGGEEEEEKE